MSVEQGPFFEFDREPDADKLYEAVEAAIRGMENAGFRVNLVIMDGAQVNLSVIRKFMDISAGADANDVDFEKYVFTGGCSTHPCRYERKIWWIIDRTNRSSSMLLE